jgi:hypothetical protein
MVRGKVQYEQCFEAANQGTPLRTPDRGPRYDERIRMSGVEVVIHCRPGRETIF